MNYGLQLYSVRDITETDLHGALEQVAQLGYENVEFAGFFGHNGEEVAQWLKELHLRASGTHTGLDALENDFDAIVACHKAIGCDLVIVPWADAKTNAEAEALLARMTAMQQKLATHGLKLGYHNHAHEFKPIGGGPSLMQRFLHDTEILLQLDTFWVYAAGEDAVQWMEDAHRLGRLPVIHIKDGFQDGEGVPLGRGTAPVEAVHAKACELSVPMVVESETLTPSGLEEARICITFLQGQCPCTPDRFAEVRDGV